MKLYFHPISSYSQKALIALYEKGLEFEPHIVPLFDPNAKAEYLKVYPMGKVPALVLDDGHLIPESSIIIEYLDSIAGPPLIFGDAEQRRKIRFKDRMFDMYVDDPVVTLSFQSMKPEDQQDPERIEKAKFQLKTMYGFMEEEFGRKAFANGDTFGMADCAAAPALFYAQKAAPFNEYENICAYWDRLASRPSVRRVQEEAQPYLKKMFG